MTKRQVRKRCFKWYGLSKFQTPCTFESLKIFPEIQSRLKHHAEIGCPKKQRFFSCGAQMARRVDGWLSTVVIIFHQSSLGLKIDTSGLQARLHLPPQTWVLFLINGPWTNGDAASCISPKPWDDDPSSLSSTCFCLVCGRELENWHGTFIHSWSIWHFIDSMCPFWDMCPIFGTPVSPKPSPMHSRIPRPQ